LSNEILGKTMVTGQLRTPIPVIEQWVQEHYALSVRAERTETERDQQFVLRDTSGRQLILKLSNPLEDPAIIDMQTRALLHIAQVAPELPTPRVVPTADGRWIVPAPWPEAAGASLRILTYLPGQMLTAAARSIEQARCLGALLAHLGVALRGFSHPADRRDISWNLALAARFIPLLDAIEDKAQRELAARHLQYFEQVVEPELNTLRTQVIHSDFNAHNVLMDELQPERATGIIDFGDIVRTQLITDVAIGCAYWVTIGADPLQYPREFVAGYERVTPLQQQELRLLPGLIAARLAVTAVITHWRAKLFPANRAYITKNTALSWRGLALLDALDRSAAEHAFTT
jgi:hydroxylysine kinase